MDNAMFVIFWDVILVAQQESVDYVLMLKKLPLLKENVFAIMLMNSPTARECVAIASIQGVWAAKPPNKTFAAFARMKLLPSEMELAFVQKVLTLTKMRCVLVAW